MTFLLSDTRTVHTLDYSALNISTLPHQQGERIGEEVLLIVRFEQLLEHVHHLSRRGNKKWLNFRILDVNQDCFCLFGDHTTLNFVAWIVTLRHQHTYSSNGLGWHSMLFRKQNNRKVRPTFRPTLGLFSVHIGPICVKIDHFPTRLYECGNILSTQKKHFTPCFLRGGK